MNTKELCSIENRGNSPNEKQQVLKTVFSPYKSRKNKTNLGKNNFGENLGGGGKKTQTKQRNKKTENSH